MERLPSFNVLASDVMACLAFYTRLPAFPFPPADRRFAEAHWAAPVAGLAVGLLGGAAFWLADRLGLPTTVAAALALAATMGVTGCLHEDGLADVADGFGGGATRERKLEIMRDSRIGTFGVAAFSLSLLLRWSALAAVASPANVFLALAGAHAASRALLPGFMAKVAPARQDGLSAGFGSAERPALAAALVGAATLILTLGPLAGLSAAACLALWFLALKRLSEHQIGGQTGDVLGALQQSGEVIVLLVACILLFP